MFTVDTDPPDTTINSRPDDTSYFSTAIFGFSSEPGATFQCKLDAAAFATCTSPKEYPHLSVGPHQFAVRATDPAGNVGDQMNPNWTVVQAQPDGQISKKATSGYIGNNVYNTTGSGQTISQKQVRNKKRIFYVRVFNDAAGETELTLRGTNAPAGATLKYFLGTSSTDISAAMRSPDGHQVTLDAGAFQLIRVEIKLKASARIGSSKSAKVTAIWDGNPILQDVVKAVVKVVRRL
jgi:hypothetical protein